MKWLILLGILGLLGISVFVWRQIAEKGKRGGNSGSQLASADRNSKEKVNSAEMVEQLLYFLYCDPTPAIASESLGYTDETDDAKSVAKAKRQLEKARESGETRAILGAWHWLRQLGEVPPAAEANQVLGVVVEINDEDFTIITGAFADGEARLYSLKGMGVVGEMSQFPTVTEAAIDCISEAKKVTQYFSPTNNRPHPKEGKALLTILTPNGFVAAESEVEALFEEDHELGKLIDRVMRLQQRLLRVYNHTETALESALDDENLERINELLEAGDDPNVDNSQGIPHLLSVAHSPKLVAALVKGGATIDRLNTDEERGWTEKALLALVAEVGLVESTQIMLDAGAKVDFSGSDHRTALYSSVVHGQHATAKLLVDYGADVNITTGDDRFPLIEATLNDDVEMIGLLVSAGANLDRIGTESNVTPLTVAAHQCELNTVRNLVGHGAAIDLPDGDSYTALMNASNRGRTEVVDALLELGANVNAVDNQGSTPLMFAAQHGFIETVESLLKAGAEMNIRGKHGFTALGLVKQHGKKHQKMIRFLEAKGAQS